MGARSSNEMQWFELKTGHIDSSPINGHKGDIISQDAKIFEEVGVYTLGRVYVCEYNYSQISNIICTLTHCGLMTPYGDRDLGHHWLR